MADATQIDSVKRRLAEIFELKESPDNPNHYYSKWDGRAYSDIRIHETDSEPMSETYPRPQLLPRLIRK